ncbi:MAG: DUF2490 domain-containing protein [Mangrovibacterium sp.]
MKILLALMLLLSVFVRTNGQENSNFYLWNTTSVVAGLSPKSSLELSVKTHYLPSDNFRDMTYADLAVGRKLNSWFQLGLAFRVSQMPKETGDDVYEYRPQFVTKVSATTHAVKFRTTNRLEYLSFNLGEAFFRYYHNLFVDFPALAPKLPKPYLGEELFTKLNGNGLHLGRLYGGLHVWESDHVGVDLFYVWQKLKSAGYWKEADVLGLNLKFKI